MTRALIPAFLIVAALAACSAETTDATSSQQDALTEATASADEAKATAEACFATFESCVAALTDGADDSTCKTQLKDCLPAEAHPGPRCGPPRGKGRGSLHGPNGCDGGARPSGPGEQAGDGTSPPRPPPPPEGAPEGEGQGAGRPGRPDGDGHSDGSTEPPFCAHVPLPPTADMVACRDALDACVADTEKDSSERQACFATDQACMKAAFEAARAAHSAESSGSTE